MDQVMVLKPVAEVLGNRSSLKNVFAIVTATLCSVSGVGLFPSQANSQIDPKLRQQVLQIIRDNPEVLLEALQAYQKQQQQQQEKARATFLQQLRTNSKAIVGQSPTKGAKNGKILLIEFSDFQCPYCARSIEPLQQFLTKHPEQVTLVYKHFPLIQIHAEALPAAKASWAAQQQGKFWEFHNALFVNQEKLGEALYVDTAKALGLDLQRFNRDRASNAARDAIAQDMRLAEQLGVDGTPFFVMNGTAVSGAVQLSDLEKILTQGNTQP
jgi:protein-disulfide isomerase